MSKHPNPWTFRPELERVPEIEASMKKRGFAKRNAWLRWAVGKVLDAEKASPAEHKPKGAAKPVKFVGESGPEIVKLPKGQRVEVTPRFKKGGRR